MARLTINDLIYPLTRQQVQASIYAVLARVGVNVTSWKSGSVVRTMIVAVSVVFAAFTTIMASIARSGFLELSSGEWLTLVARYVYGVERNAASYASGSVVLSNAQGGIYSLDAGDLIVANVDTGRTYRSTAPFTLPAATGTPPAITPGTVTVPIAATEAGADSSADAGKISHMVTTLLGVTCTNPGSLTGFNEEIDTLLRQRCSETLGALSPMGPWDAYSTALRKATRLDGTSLNITRVGLTADGYGHVDVYCATDAGGVTGDPTDPTTDLGAAMAAVLEWAAPQAITPRVHGATELIQPVTYSVWMYNTSGLTAEQIEDTIAAALRVYFPKQPVGGNVADAPPGAIYHDTLKAAIAQSIPEIFRVELTTPPGDVVLSGDQVAVLGLITPALIKPVPPPEAFHP
jgi:phage-related baseplate assembly protein